MLLAIFSYIILASTVKIFLFFNRRLRARLITILTGILCLLIRFVINIKVSIEGCTSLLNENGNFIIANHLSYLDGIILAGLFKVIFVSKLEVKKWPIFGLMASFGETIFIDRQRKEKSIHYINQAADVLKQGINILVFPEGTSTNGEKLSVFQSIHFQAPLDAGASILPVSITYTDIGNERIGIINRDKACWYGQVKFHEHLFGIFKLARPIKARVTVHPKIEAKYFGDRKALSNFLHSIISADYPLFK